MQSYPGRSLMNLGNSKRPEGIEVTPRILLIDDEVLAREQLAAFCTSNGYTVEIADSCEEGLNRVNKRKIDVVIVNSDGTGRSGGEFLQHLERDHPAVSVIMTGYRPIDYHDNALQYGTCDYIAKPFDYETIHSKTQVALNKARVFAESTRLRKSLKDTTEGEFEPLLSKTPAMHQVFETIQMVAPTNMTVLLEGEVGTGKELIASAIHHQSSRCHNRFIPVNCAGFPDSLLELELFGSKEDGPFGTELRSPGKIKLADGGTLFLDEIDAMAPFVQSKFMQVLEDCTSVHLGGQQSLESDVRLIAASNVPLEYLVSQGKMRKDLYYRINVVPIHVLSLRERRDDIPLLADEFLRRHSIASRKGILGVSCETLARLIQYHWPGNIRELQNVLEKAIVLTKGSVIDHVDLPVGKEPVNRDASTFMLIRQ